jgi:hypothetical protein
MTPRPFRRIAANFAFGSKTWFCSNNELIQIRTFIENGHGQAFPKNMEGQQNFYGSPAKSLFGKTTHNKIGELTQ